MVASAADAQTLHHAGPENYRGRLALLRPGDTLVLAAREYRAGLPLHKLSGTPGRPITITGPARGAPARFIARDGHNTVSIVDSHHLVIRDLALEGNNLPVDAGTAIYLGNADGSAPFVAGLIERNLIVDTLGYNLHVGHPRFHPDIPGLPTGRSMTTIRHNVFAGPEADSPEFARLNVRAYGTGISVIRKEEAPRYLQIVTANAVFASVAFAGGDSTGNVEAPLSEAGTVITRPLAPLGQLDLYPGRGWVPTASTAADVLAPFPDSDKDFNGRRRPAGSVGAYGGRGKKPRMVAAARAETGLISALGVRRPFPHMLKPGVAARRSAASRVDRDFAKPESQFRKLIRFDEQCRLTTTRPQAANWKPQFRHPTKWRGCQLTGCRSEA